ncbi:MAG: hypothetical protein HY920_01400, partial [Elusimicrobia bacterium]|nr:hypothetical protein [Elusimicrobiota bacterium]
MTYIKLSRRYELNECVSQDGLYASYRAEDVKEKKAVLVSILSAAAQNRSPETLLRYRQVAEKLTGLKAAGLQEVLVAGQDEEGRD